MRLRFSTLIDVFIDMDLAAALYRPGITFLSDDQFAAGSMLPKIEAGVSFVEKGTGRRTIITDMAHAKDGYCEKTGTIIK